MKITALIFIVSLLLLSIATAETSKHHYNDQELFESRFDDLKDQFYDIKYELINKISSQYHTIKEQEKEIIELNLKIKDLEYNLFQTTQSLRNLELEVWDMKKSSSEKMKADENLLSTK